MTTFEKPLAMAIVAITAKMAIMALMAISYAHSNIVIMIIQKKSTKKLALW